MKKYSIILSGMAIALLSGCGDSVDLGDKTKQQPLSTTSINTNDNQKAQVSKPKISLITQYEGQLPKVDSDGDPIRYTIETQPQHGTVTLDEDGHFLYRSDEGYIGEESFSYRINNNPSSHCLKTITINITDDNKITSKALTLDELRELIKNWAINHTKENADAIIYANTSQITDMSGLFDSKLIHEDLGHYSVYDFNLDISRWDVSNVTNMSGMFWGAHSFNQPLDSWNVSSVTDMHYMFYGANSFNQPLDSWDVSNVTDMSDMFSGASSFNQPLDSWNVSSVTDMSDMFTWASSFNQPLDSWDVSNVTNMSQMFYGAISFNQPLNRWDVSNVTEMFGMFSSANSFNQPLDNWDVSSVTNMPRMFAYAKAFNQDISGWDVKNVKDIYDFATGSALQDSFNPFKK